MIRIDHFTVVGLIPPQPSSECEAKGDLALIQTSFLFLRLKILISNRRAFCMRMRQHGLLKYL